MAIPVHKYPYSNLHDLNLDWVLDELKTLKDKVEEQENKITSLETDAETKSEQLQLLNNKVTALETRVSALEASVGSSILVVDNISTENLKVVDI